jgi:hypothetical protein
MSSIRAPHLLLLASVATALACSKGGTISIGATTRLGGNLSDYAGAWDGYAEAYTFQPSETDRFRLVLDAQGKGTVQVGTDPLLPPVTDPTVGYPPGQFDVYETFGQDSLMGGVLYPVYAVQVREGRIQLGLKPSDVWVGWCALQKSQQIFDHWSPPDAGLADAAGTGPLTDAGVVPVYSYRCAYGSQIWNSSSDTWDCSTEDYSMPEPSNVFESIDCQRLQLCGERICACSPTGCTSDPAVPSDAGPSHYPVELDATLDSTATTLAGTLIVNFTRVTVHLQRQ